MLRLKTIVLTAVIAASFSFGASDAQAGPLLDWLRGIGKRPCNTCNQQQPQYGYYQGAAQNTAQFAGTAAPNPYNLQPGQCMKTCQKTCQRTVVNYVPATEYRTTWKRVPVTQYKPVTNSDPCTGCTVTCMKPCTTYTYQCQRVPYTTYRPVYRTETYKVPVTTITNDCATGNCPSCPTAGCSTCGVQSQSYQGQPLQNFAPTQAAPMQAAPTQAAPTYSYPANNSPSLNGSVSGSTSRLRVPNSTLSTAANYKASNVRAARVNVRPTQRSYSTNYSTNRFDSIPRSRQQDWNNRSQPATVNVDDQTAESTITRRFSYSPVRLASFNAEVSQTRNEVPVRSISRNVETLPTQGKSLREINSAWNDVK